jgi:hypothetical protein
MVLILAGLGSNSEVCAQTQPHNDPLEIISNRPRPNVLFLFDTSGSMLWDVNTRYGEMSVRRENNNGQSSELRSTGYSDTSNGMNSFLMDSDNPRSRMGSAKEATREILSQIEDVNIGMGRFKRRLWQHRFRAEVPSDLNQMANMEPGYYYYYWDNQTPDVGEINIPYRRRPTYNYNYEYPYCRTVRRDNGVYWSWDATDTIYYPSTNNTRYINGDHYTRMYWYYSKVENSRRQMFKGLTDDGWFIYRDSYSNPNERYPNKLNQVVNIDIFLSDSEMLQEKANFELEETITVQRYVESAYGVNIDRTLEFTYWPQVADWDEDNSCSGGEIVVGIQDRFTDDFDTPYQDESDNRDQLLALTSPISSKAEIYDFTTDSPELLAGNAFWGFGSTPLATTLQTAKTYFDEVVLPRDVGYQIDHCRDNFVILLTDGLETCGGNPESVAQDLYQNYNIKVYVIAFISSTTQADAIAAAGGTEEAFNADNKDELVDALQAIFSEIKTSVQLTTPVTAGSSEDAADYVDGDMALFPFFDFPGFKGRLQARKMFKTSVIEVDPRTGEAVTDTNGDPVIIEDDISDERVLELVNDPDDPIDKDLGRQIVGLQLDPPVFKWDAGSLLSEPYIEESDPSLVYEHLKADTSDIDDDGNYDEIIVNPAYKTADERRILTTLSIGGNMDVVDFDVATLMDSSADITATKALLDISDWSDEEAEFLINYVRGKQVVRFTQVTEIYGRTFQPGDPTPDPSSPDDDNDGVPDEFLYKERDWKLGDFISSTPVVVKAPAGQFRRAIDDDDNSLDDYDEFKDAHEDINPLVIIGANDGMLHAFSLNGVDSNGDGDFDDSGEIYPGEEVWAFVLPDLMPKLQNLFYDSPDDNDYAPDGQKLEPHQYFVDGQITLSIPRVRIHTGDTDSDGASDDPEFRIVMLFGEGRGGNYYWMFDVTDPVNPNPVWAITDPSMGVTISRPAVGAIEVGSQPELDNDIFKYYCFMGSGYDYSQVDGSATVGNVFYKVDLATGAIEESFSAGDESGGADIPNAIPSRGILVDEDDDFFVERVYFADLDGHIWRWNLENGTKVNLFEANASPLISQQEMLDRPIGDSFTYANVFGYHVITAATGGDTRLYLEEDGSRANYPNQRIYFLLDTDKNGDVVSYLNGNFDEDGNFQSQADTIGAELPEYVISENQPAVSTFTEYDEEDKIYRGFQTFYPLYTPDPAGLKSIRCTFGESDLLILDSIFSESSIIESTSGALISMGEGKATGIAYTGGNILFSIGDQIKITGDGINWPPNISQVKARLKVLSWKEIF